MLKCSASSSNPAIFNVDKLIDAANTQSAPFEFLERFAFKIENLQTNGASRNRNSSARKVTVESLSGLELFLIRDKLKGKKKPIKKKNHDAQQFADQAEGEYYLNQTKNFFTNFNITNRKVAAISDLKVCKSDLLENICFIITCDPAYFFCEETERTKNEYFLRTYKSLLKKRKIYKIPSKAVFFVNQDSPFIEINPDHSIVWFSNPITTLSN